MGQVMNRNLGKILIAVVLVFASVIAMVLRPTHRIADDGPGVDLEAMIPEQFGDWQLAPRQSGQIVNPLQKEVLDRIYTQTLSRTYVNAKGDFIMLSIAYGADQSDAKQLHYPEVCYPAQGFQVKGSLISKLKTAYGDIPVKRVITVMGKRSEPLTYWTTVGHKVVLGARETKTEQLRYGFKGLIPDGLIFRVSTITGDIQAGFQLQDEFVSSLVNSLPVDARAKIAGLSDGGRY